MKNPNFNMQSHHFWNAFFFHNRYRPTMVLWLNIVLYMSDHKSPYFTIFSLITIQNAWNFLLWKDWLDLKSHKIVSCCGRFLHVFDSTNIRFIIFWLIRITTELIIHYFLYHLFSICQAKNKKIKIDFLKFISKVPI